MHVWGETHFPLQLLVAYKLPLHETSRHSQQPDASDSWHVCPSVGQELVQALCVEYKSRSSQVAGTQE
jgi:hypothetical protein